MGRGLRRHVRRAFPQEMKRASFSGRPSYSRIRVKRQFLRSAMVKSSPLISTNTKPVKKSAMS